MKYHFTLVIFLLSLAISVGVISQENRVKPLDPMLENYGYPYPVKFISLSIQQENFKMAYMDVRPDQSNGKTIVLFHGKNFSGAYWKRTADALSQAGFRVVIPDQLGFGKSSKPEHVQYSFQLLASNTKMLLDSLKISKAAVLGHSMGGMLATRFTLMFPELVDRLILENPIGLEDWKVVVPYQTVDTWYKNELSQNYEKIKKYQQENYYHGQWKPEYDEWVTMLVGWSLHPNYNLVAWNSALTYDMIFTQPVVYEFDRIKTPTLLIIGQLDRTALGKQLVPEAVRAQLVTIPGWERKPKQRSSVQH